MKDHPTPQSDPRDVQRRAMGVESSFHNPYTFIPFRINSHLSEPSLLTVDEGTSERAGRFTGIIELEIETLSPLLTANPVPHDPEAKHKTYDALKIGTDVILPATGVRGVLRSLLTVLIGSALTGVDAQAYLCQGRDAKLGPRGRTGGNAVPANAFLARVVKAGDLFRSGRVELGETELITAQELGKLFGGDNGLNELRPTSRISEKRIFIDHPTTPTRRSEFLTAGTRWEVKLSGRPVTAQGKREGVFNGNGIVLEIPAEYWAAYASRHRHAVRSELKEGDLIWLEPATPETGSIRSIRDVKSLQWARWGREGQRYEDCVPEDVLPDYLDPDGRVGEVTDLFGMVSPEQGSDAAAFAGRIRPENIVFPDAANKVTMATLAPLAPPHPGCVPFYRKIGHGELEIPKKAELRGYKVYRATQEAGGQAPWNFAVQGVYNEQGNLGDSRQKVNKTVGLLAAGVVGTLRVAVRALSPREMALLLQTCHLPWRLGGGKPLGLGLCEVTVVNLIDENGHAVDVKALRWEESVRDIQERVALWAKTQLPVQRLRYPRAVQRNNNRLSRGGHVWFSRHAALRKTDDRNASESTTFELQGRDLREGARTKANSGKLPAQTLPDFNPDHPMDDVLYGYDFVTTESDERINQVRPIVKIEPFDPAGHIRGNEQSGGNTSQNRDTRQTERELRAAGATAVPPPAQPTLSAGCVVKATLLEEKTKKSGWRARHEDSGLSGPIQNSPEVPATAKAGDKMDFIVGSVTVNEIALKYASAEGIEAARKKFEERKNNPPARMNRPANRR